MRDVNFELCAGESLVILGPNGSGKTTLLRTLLNLQPPSGGRILFGFEAGRNVISQCAYVPQSNAGGLDGFTSREVIQIGLMARKPWYSRPDAHEASQAAKALETLGIGALADENFSAISGGEQQLVLIARALAMDAKIIFFDEPAASLDIANQYHFTVLCLRLKQSGVALVLTTHNPQQALALGESPRDQTLTISRAGSVTVGATSSVCTTAHLTALYGVPVNVIVTASGAIARL